MHVFSLPVEQRFDPRQHVENVLGEVSGGDFTIACWEPGQISPNHCHPFATEIYFCFEGGGMMHTQGQSVAITPGTFAVHPPGEVHEYENGAHRTVLFRVRYGSDMASRHKSWRGKSDWQPRPEDLAYYASLAKTLAPV